MLGRCAFCEGPLSASTALTPARAWAEEVSAQLAKAAAADPKAQILGHFYIGPLYCSKECREAVLLPVWSLIGGPI